MLIYKVTNTINGKSYIGQTTRTLQSRIREHLYSPKTKQIFHKALKKYGIDNFHWEVLCKCDTKEELDEMEFHYIIQYNTHGSGNGYNMTWGGEGTLGYRHTTKTKNLISQNNRGNSHTEEWKANHSITLKGRKYTENHRLKISNSLKGRVFSETHLKNMSLSQIGKIRTKETKEKMSKLRQGHQWNKKGVNNKLSKQYVIIEPNGNQIVITGLGEYCRNHSLNTSLMVQVAKGNRKQHKGYRCLYKKENL